jgi:isorenieratene synthase
LALDETQRANDSHPEGPPRLDAGGPGDRRSHVLVVGGGVAGLSAAIELAERGLKVTLLEASETVGGKVRGWRDAGGHSVEHGLHGWWLEYTNFRDLLTRVGLKDNLTELIGPFTVIHRNGPVDRLTFSNLPSPFHVFGMLRGLKSVSLRGKLSAIRAGLAIVGFDPSDEYFGLDRFDLHTWLRHAGLSSQALKAVFEPTIRSNLFLPIEQTSAAAGLNALFRGLRRRESWRFSWLRGNAGDYLWRPLAEYFVRKGGDIRLRSRVTGLQLAGSRVLAVVTSEASQAPTTVASDHVILALDIESCKSLILNSLNHIPFFNRLLNLSSTDVLVTRTWFEGSTRLRYHDAMLIGFRIVDAFVDVGNIQPELGQPGMLVIETQSYLGKQWMTAPEATIRELVLRDLAEALPELDDSRPVTTIVTRHPGLFTAFDIGFETSRPPVSTPLSNLYLAGDWVRCPEQVMFMENAVLTGRYAASAVLAAEGLDPVKIIAAPPPDLPVRVIQMISRVVRKAKRGFQRLIGFRPIGEGEPA